MVMNYFVKKGMKANKINADFQNTLGNFAPSYSYELLPHLPYSPDVTPSDFHFFPMQKIFLRWRFSSNVELIARVYRPGRI